MVSPVTLKNKPNNYNEIIIDGLDEALNVLKITPFDSIKGPYSSVLPFYDFGEICTNHTLNHPKVRELMRSDTSFDAILLENFADEALIGLGHHFKAPVIAIGTFTSNYWVEHLLGNDMRSSVFSSPHAGLTDQMNFSQRVSNLVFNTWFAMTYYYNNCRKQKRIYDAAFPDPKPDFYDQLKHGVAFGLVNSHFTLNHARPHLPNMVHVGGVQLDRYPKPLNPALQEYLDTAEDGAVYFSLGSYIRASTMPPKMRDSILKTFAKYPKIKFLWKWEETNLPNKTDNVLIQDWMPQNSILAHANIRCFITHGGLLGITESIFHGVPMIGIPILGDQWFNVAHLVKKEVGLHIGKNNLTEESLTWALDEMLSSTKYKENVLEWSKRYRDQPMDPLDTMTYWVEYVIRHKGAPFLHSSAQDLNFWQYHMLDIFALFLLVVGLILWMIVALYRLLKRNKKCHLKEP